MTDPPPSVQIVVRTDRGAALIPALERTIRSWDPEQTVEDCETVTQAVEKELTQSRRVIYADWHVCVPRGSAGLCWRL